MFGLTPQLWLVSCLSVLVSSSQAFSGSPPGSSAKLTSQWTVKRWRGYEHCYGPVFAQGSKALAKGLENLRGEQPDGITSAGFFTEETSNFEVFALEVPLTQGLGIRQTRPQGLEDDHCYGLMCLSHGLGNMGRLGSNLTERFGKSLWNVARCIPRSHASRNGLSIPDEYIRWASGDVSWIYRLSPVDMGQPNDQTPSEPELRAGQNGTRDRGRMMKIGGLDDTTRQVMRERTALVFGDRQRDEGRGPDQRCDGSDGSGSGSE
ncbi:hypothetical protein C8F04DRAFT_1186617 [Mycena alexandri]|uniref:Uncharacterized protein n=1 Tax=Mycena alexandri TaxID=1745969 RepID=A0AAD6WX08_9AGAR|nr:hypothetical protein C8F04DRAFT_1186617 [Mycena alexandri]